jgi:hypothetical protein
MEAPSQPQADVSLVEKEHNDKAAHAMSSSQRSSPATARKQVNSLEDDNQQVIWIEKSSEALEISQAV